MLSRLALATLFLVTPALAETPVTGAVLHDAVSGNTVQGSMSATGAYSEFYASDGVIKGAGYSGAWSIEGDTMCFAYGEAPADCWNAHITGDQIVWVKDGQDLGTGTILHGNPNGY